MAHVRVSGRASALLGGAGRSLASHRLPLDGGPTYYYALPCHRADRSAPRRSKSSCSTLVSKVANCVL